MNWMRRRSTPTLPSTQLGLGSSTISRPGVRDSIWKGPPTTEPCRPSGRMNAPAASATGQSTSGPRNSTAVDPIGTNGARQSEARRKTGSARARYDVLRGDQRAVTPARRAEVHSHTAIDLFDGAGQSRARPCRRAAAGTTTDRADAPARYVRSDARGEYGSRVAGSPRTPKTTSPDGSVVSATGEVGDGPTSVSSEEPVHDARNTSEQSAAPMRGVVTPRSGERPRRRTLP